ncbi:hypothetical protein Bmul_5853 [Burkholderia multivorans ATCC 17616]|nr:hypothetical protein Bmul_5853 [Burkholderia multivorans ATCC 17616]
MAGVLPRAQTASKAALARADSIDHDQRLAIRDLPHFERLRSRVHLPRRHAAEPGALRRHRAAGRVGARTGARVRARLRPHVAHLAGPIRSTRRLGACAAVDETFIRTWRLYLANCEAGFAERRTDVMHFIVSSGS